MPWWNKILGGSKVTGRVDYYEEGIDLLSEGKYHEALTSFRLALKESPGDTVVLQQIAIAYTRIGMTDEAVKTYRHVLQKEPGSAGAHYGLAYLLLRRGDCARATALTRESLRLNGAIQDWRAMAACLVALASVARTQGQLARAARLCGAAEQILASVRASLLPVDRQEYERTVTNLKRTLYAEEVEAAWAAGRALSLEQAVDFALSDT